MGVEGNVLNADIDELIDIELWGYKIFWFLNRLFRERQFLHNTNNYKDE